MKRRRHRSSSEDSDSGSNCTSWSQHSASHPRRAEGKRPSEVFRTDLITAMKLHDSHQLSTDDYYVLADPWRQEWEKGVQVPVSPHSIPKPSVRTVEERSSAVMFTRPKKLIRSSGPEAAVLGYVGICTLAEGMCRYDLDEEDMAWLQLVNQEFSEMGMHALDALTMERAMEEFERRCYDNMRHAMETEEGLGIEYDEDVVCDVCQSPYGEDDNEMVFCDKCNICVHQACYGIVKVPEGSWLCRICALGILPECQLCPKKGGAMKPTRSGTKWAHVSCALWIPEVSIGNPEKMEPITNISQIPSNRWALMCCLCKQKNGACIQCSAKNCRIAFHVTCGLHRGLKMNTILTEADEVKFKAFCPKHSGMDWTEEDEDGGGRERGKSGTDSNTPGTPGTSDPLLLSDADGAKLSGRKLKVQQLEEEFFRFVAVEDVAKHLQLAGETVDFLFQYWKLKRKAKFNQPLITPKKEEEESLARSEQEVLIRRLRLFTHLRQDLERVRNLTYMVIRREKIKRSVCRVQEQIFHHHVKLLEQGRLNGASSTRRLEEAMFYFRASPNVSTSPQPLRGHAGQNTELDTPRLVRGKGSHKLSPLTHREPDEMAKSPRTEDLIQTNLYKEDRLNPCPFTALGGHIGQTVSGTPQSVSFTDVKERNSSVIVTRKGGNHGDSPPVTRHSGQDWSKRARLHEPTSLRSKQKSTTRGKNETTHSQTELDEMLDNMALSHSRMSATVTTESKYNGALRRTNGAAHAHLKKWGSFRIPKRSDKTKGEQIPPDGGSVAQEKSSHPLKRLDGSPEATPPQLRARPQSASETPSQPRQENLSQSEQVSHGKRCHAQRLRSHNQVARRYGADLIHHGVLAS